MSDAMEIGKLASEVFTNPVLKTAAIVILPATGAGLVLALRWGPKPNETGKDVRPGFGKQLKDKSGN